MNTTGIGLRLNERGRRGKRGVSPIIATILLVAITVVLAAVLYVLISGLTHGVGSADLGTNFGWATPTNATGASTQPVGCALADYCYEIEVASATGITTSDVSFTLHTSTGGPLAFPAKTYITLVSSSNANVTYWTPTAGWNSAGVTVSAAEFIDINTGVKTTYANGLYGDELVALGTGSYTGSVPASSFF